MTEPWDVRADGNGPRCIAFSDIRGDYRLLLTLLSQLMRVAEFDPTNNTWKWIAANTVVVCLGNYTNRFEPKGINRLTISTKDAIQDELKILDTFFQLMQPNDMGNTMVVLTGNHELSNLLDLPGYEYYQMAYPQEADDRRMRKNFVEEALKPFMQHHSGLVAGWGRPGGTIYFSHGSLVRKWFEKLNIKSIEDLNRRWRGWIEGNQVNQLGRCAEPDSPIMSSVMALKPQVWREFDEEYIVKILGEDPNPRFVQSTLIPVQRLHFYSYDTNLKEPQFDAPKQPGYRPTMLVSRNFDAIDEVYFIHNAMADTFCMYEDVDRQPQALQFNLILNNMNEALFLRVKPIVMEFQEYQTYIRELPFGSCQEPTTLAPMNRTIKPFTPEEQIAIKPSLSEGTMEVVHSGIQHIESVGIVVFSHDMNRMFMVPAQEKEHLTIPLGKRQHQENDWDAMMRVLHETAQVDKISFTRGGTITDFEGTTRIWIKRTLNSIASPVGKWVKLEDILVSNLARHIKTMLCVLSRNQLIPMLKNFHSECPSWLKSDDPDIRIRVKPWWELREGEPYIMKK